MGYNPIELMKESSSLAMTANAIPTARSLRESHHSYFLETLSFLSETNRDMYEANRVFYVTLTEATNPIAIHEGFGDFFDKVKEVINKFLAFIKSLFERFVTAFNKLIGRDKYILNNKDKFRDFDSRHEFTITGYKYTIYDHVPIVDCQAAFDQDFMFNVAGDDDSKNLVLRQVAPNKGYAAGIKASYATLSQNLENEKWYDNFRGKVLDNGDLAISKEDFADELFMTFRNRENISEEIDVTSVEVQDSLRRFEKYKKDLDSVKKLKARIDSEYNKVRKAAESAVINNRADGKTTAKLDDRLGTPVVLSADDITAMDNYMKAKVTQIQEMANIHALAFSAKLDAITDCYKQDKGILYKALSRIQANKEA